MAGKWITVNGKRFQIPTETVHHRKNGEELALFEEEGEYGDAVRAAQIATMEAFKLPLSAPRAERDKHTRQTLYVYLTPADTWKITDQEPPSSKTYVEVSQGFVGRFRPGMDWGDDE